MNENEILNLDECAALLKLQPSQLRELTRTRTQVRSEHPIPFIKIHNKCVRFLKSDVIGWLNSLAVNSRGTSRGTQAQ